MIISRSADYAFRAMIYLARKRGPRFIPLNEIAREMGTPPFLLARLMQGLVRARLVQSMKGHHGGFRLLGDPSEIRVDAIVRAIMGPFKAFDCSNPGDCGLNDACNMIDLFARAEEALQRVFESVTLEQLARTPSAVNGHSTHHVNLVLESSTLQ